MEREAPKKRRKTSDSRDNASDKTSTLAFFDSSALDSNHATRSIRESLKKSVSPPLLKNRIDGSDAQALDANNVKETQFIASPIQLSKVENLPDRVNIDTVSLKDIVGHPLVKECWTFNYLIDVDFLMGNFDADVREEIKLYVVHGSWKREDTNRLAIEEAVSRHKNARSITAYMPEAFGTHHSKMIILVRHDDLAQVVIFTANLIARDWEMCQAVWSSPLLPLLSTLDEPQATDRIGSGSRFKFDLLSYLRVYEKRLKDLVTTLEKHDFGAIRAALVASVPCRQSPNPESNSTAWGWPGLQSILGQLPCTSSTDPRIVMQVSSIATLGVEDKYLKKTFFSALAKARNATQGPANGNAKADFKIIFPTAEEIRRTISGYECGASIHMKTQTPQQAKQLQYLRPMLCHWAGDTGTQPNMSSNGDNIRRAGRRRAGPHIKTYVRFPDSQMKKIDWAMVTSANLSKQAWGAEPGKDGQVRICSYEIGVVVWPALWAEDLDEKATMIPTFQKDKSERSDVDEVDASGTGVVVGFRMPYDLPLVPYADSDEPWCATKADDKPDWLGRAWPGYG